LAVSASDSEHPLALQHILSEPLWTGNIGQTAIKNFFHEQVAARNNIADHVDIRIEIDLFGRKSFDQLDTLRFELGTHGRVNIGIAASNAMACLFCQNGNAAHECAANAEDVYMHGCKF